MMMMMKLYACQVVSSWCAINVDAMSCSEWPRLPGQREATHQCQLLKTRRSKLWTMDSMRSMLMHITHVCARPVCQRWRDKGLRNLLKQSQLTMQRLGFGTLILVKLKGICQTSLQSGQAENERKKRENKQRKQERKARDKTNKKVQNLVTVCQSSEEPYWGSC